MRKNFALFALLLLPMCGLGIAQQPSSPALLPAGVSLTGTWSCRGAFRNGKPHESVYTSEVILGSKWLRLTEKDTVPSTGYVAEYLIGYDPQTKRFVEFDANNFGAATYNSAEGWLGSTLTMTSDGASTTPDSQSTRNRFRYTVQSSDTFDVDWQVSKTAEGDWTTSDHLSCKRPA